LFRLGVFRRWMYSTRTSTLPLSDLIRRNYSHSVGGKQPSTTALCESFVHQQNRPLVQLERVAGFVMGGCWLGPQRASKDMCRWRY